MADMIVILGSVFLVSLASIIGIAALVVRRDLLDKILFILMAFAAGSLIGGAMFDLIPEAIELGGVLAFQYIAVGIVIFFVIERFIHWHHHHHILEHDHEHKDQKKPFAYLNLIGEGVHNFLDGTIIAASYLVSFEIGIISTIAIVLHEIPQEIGDFGILVKGGFSPKKALFVNFLISLSAFAGAFVILGAASVIPGLTLIMLSIAGGGFLYIALGTLIPELHHETDTGKIIIQVFFLILGILMLFYLGILFPG